MDAMDMMDEIDEGPELVSGDFRFEDLGFEKGVMDGMDVKFRSDGYEK
jgi:hypothetical protein